MRAGLLDIPVRIYDLSVGGCFVNALHEEDEGVRCTLRIHLPPEGWIEVTGVSLYRRPGYGFAMQFVDVDADLRQRIDRALAAITSTRPA